MTAAGITGTKKKKFWGECQRLHYLFIEIEMN